MSNAPLSKLLRELDIDAVPHGFRSTFRDWCSESARVPREVTEACLAHTVKGVEGAYARSDLLDLRRKLMERWAAYLATGCRRHGGTDGPAIEGNKPVSRAKHTI